MRKCPRCREETTRASGYCRDCHRRYVAARYVPKFRELVRCGGCDRAFVARRRGARFCGAECRDFVRWAAKRSTRPRPPRAVLVDCGACGVTFERRPRADDTPDRRPCCSKRCAQRLGALSANLARWGEPAPGTHRAKDRARCARRRARIAAQIVELVDPDVVFERDRWRCHLCRKRIDRRLDGNDPMGPTIDHLVPLADGGAHSYANVAAAHRLCNVRRVRGGVVQLALLG